MSSKLLTMKFMQRAAASSTTSSPSTPDQPPPKRQRIGDTSPEILDVDSLADKRAVQAALAAEEAKRQIALERQAADAGDTRWVLTFKPELKTPHIKGEAAIKVVETGFAAIDHALPAQITSTDDEGVNSDRPLIIGRRSFGKFNRTIEVFPVYNASYGKNSKFHYTEITRSFESGFVRFRYGRGRRGKVWR
jgi:M-phase phosphoprotein 6